VNNTTALRKKQLALPAPDQLIFMLVIGLNLYYDFSHKQHVSRGQKGDVPLHARRGKDRI